MYQALCSAYLGLGDYENSVKAYERAVSQGSSSRATQTAVGISYLKLGKPERAIPPLQEATRLAPDIAINHYLLGVAYNNAGQLDEAADQFLRSIGLDSKYSLPTLLWRRFTMNSRALKTQLASLRKQFA